ncbi:MAG: NAD(+)/NADH kinase [Deltaproteobacteria bacterium]|nr:NAD(+)/NADH kinase [Deltaproteobacteria bacterium]
MVAVPRVVVIHRPSVYQELIARHATRQQAEFFLATRGQSIEMPLLAHRSQLAALDKVAQAIPISWRRSRVSRFDLNRFVFEPDDVVVAVGQDGLVANVAKYLREQPVIGINPDPEAYEGVLVPHRPQAIVRLLGAIEAGRAEVESRCMARVEVDDGQFLLALNEVFVGHRSHQSARYRVSWQGRTESQSSSGLIASTGTGATGWARSICLRRLEAPPLPAPTEPRLSFFVRESWPSVATGTEVQDGVIDSGQTLELTSLMNQGGVIFGDGIEDDRIDFHWGMTARIAVAELRLRLVR